MLKKIMLAIVVLVLSLSCLFAADRPTVAVVLSGGGAKGIAHIALLEKLEELGIPVDIVIGTSMGSLIGGLYSAGYSPADIRTLISENDLSQLFNVIESKGYKSLIEPFVYKSESLTIGLGNGILSISGILDDYKIMNFFYEALGNLPESMDFDDLCIPFRCVGTNAVTGERKVFEDGSLIDSMRASMSIPLAFSPMEIDGQLYVDGGLVDNMPVKLAKDLGYDIIIAEDVNAKFEVTNDLYDSISTTAGALFRVIINNTINDQYQYADIVLKPDTTGLGIFSFSVPDTVIERGEVEIESRIDELQAIADRFTEEQKEYKDPTRKGDYFTKYSEKEHKIDSSVASQSSEKAFNQTRLSLGLKISSNVRHYFKEYYPIEFMITPGIEANLFIKEVKGSKISLNTKIVAGFPTSISTSAAYNMIEKKNSLYTVLNANVKVGSLTNATDNNIYCVSSTEKNIESKLEGKFGFKITDESTHNFDLYAVATQYIIKAQVLLDDYESKQCGSHMFQTFYPHLEASYVWYGESHNTSFDIEGSRFDFLGTAGIIGGNLIYKLGVAFEFEIPTGKKSGLWFDATAFTTREPDCLSDSYISYGGWDGVPGYSYNVNIRDYVYGGIGYQIQLSDKLFSSYLQLEVRAGFREDKSAYSNVMLKNDNLSPFAYLKNGKFDLGFGVGVGFKSFLGEALIGIGLTKDLDGSLYINIY